MRNMAMLHHVAESGAPGLVLHLYRRRQLISYDKYEKFSWHIWTRSGDCDRSHQAWWRPSGHRRGTMCGASWRNGSFDHRLTVEELIAALLYCRPAETGMPRTKPPPFGSYKTCDFRVSGCDVIPGLLADRRWSGV